MAVGDRIGKAEGRVGPRLCAHPAPCNMAPAWTELILRPDGTRAQVGNPPPELCGTCPDRASSRPRVRHVEVVLDHRNRHGDHARGATSGATLPPAAHNGGEGEHDAQGTTGAPTAPEPEPDDGLPAAWGPDHPARLALEGRELPPRRRRSDAGVINRPEDFGL